MKSRSRITAAVIAGLSLIQCGVSSAANPSTALREASYQLSSGDINGDGVPDLVAKASGKLITLPLDDDLTIPLRVPSFAKSFALVSGTGGTYTLVTNPPQSMIDASPNRSAAIAAFGDLTGSGYLSMFIPSIAAGMPNFVVSITADGALQLRQHVTQALAGIDLNAPGVTVAFNDENRDGRADLVISKAGRVVSVLFADANGNLSPPEESKTAEMVWNHALSAMSKGDKAGALAYFTQQSRADYDSMLTAAGSDMAGIAASVIGFRMLYVFRGTAEAVVTANLNGKVTMHFVTLVMGANGWEIRDL